MKTSRRTAIIVGALFLAGYVGIFAGDAISGPILNSPDYLRNAYPNRIRVIIGIFVELLINDIPVVGIGVLLYPILKKFGEGLALWYASTRVIEAVTLVISKISALSLITLSREYIEAGAPDASAFRLSGTLALAGRHWAFDVVNTVFFIVGTVMLYSMLVKSKLVPRIISIWGLIAVTSLIAANIIGVPDVTQGFRPGQLLYFPIVTSEVLLAIWLIAKGFNEDQMALKKGA